MKYIIAIISISIFISCNSSKKITADPGEKKLTNIYYGSFPSSKMDVFLPANRSPKTPFVIILHGGAWTLGDKVWGMRTQDSLAAHGIASANMDYRYADNDKTHFQELLKDIDSVINFCEAHAAEWNTRKSGFIMNGESAGAHLALLYGYTTTKKISSIIAECAPTDMTDTAYFQYYLKNDPSVLQAIFKMVGTTYEPPKPLDPLFRAASPLFQIKNIPTLFFHGTADPLVNYSNAQKLDAALTAKGYDHKLVTMPGAGHDVGFNTPEGRAKIYGEIVDWIWKRN